jgi:hypothetical protein
MDSQGGGRKRFRGVRGTFARTPKATHTLGADEAELVLYQRIDHLETELQALQDAVYRDMKRHDAQIAELRQMIEPSTLARALSEDARRRGL